LSADGLVPPSGTTGNTARLRNQRTNTPLRVPLARQEWTPRPRAGDKARISMRWAAMGPRWDGTLGLGQQRRPVRSTRQISDPLRREGCPVALWRAHKQRL